MSTVSPGRSAAIRSAPQAVTTTMPRSVTPMPKWATAVPQAERGSPAARRSAAPSGTRRTMVRSARSISAPAMTKIASPTQRRQHRTAVLQRETGSDGDGGDHGRGKEALRGAKKVTALPAEQRPERHRQQQRHEQRAERCVEEWRPD